MEAYVQVRLIGVADEGMEVVRVDQVDSHIRRVPARAARDCPKRIGKTRWGSWHRRFHAWQNASSTS